MKVLKKQGVAWAITAVMIVIAVIIGLAKGNTANGPVAPDNRPGSSGAAVDSFYVYDDANVLSAKTEEKLTERNLKLYTELDVLVGVVTCNYGGELYSYAMDYADRIGLGSYDFIVVLDISGENYWLIQGSDLVDRFSDDQCGDYAWHYMEKDFARGDYDDAVLSLTEALEEWYFDNF